MRYLSWQQKKKVTQVLKEICNEVSIFYDRYSVVLLLYIGSHLMEKNKTLRIKKKIRAGCTIKERNGTDLTEADDIKKRWQEYTEKLYKKDRHNPDNHDGVITHLEPDILE